MTPQNDGTSAYQVPHCTQHCSLQQHSDLSGKWYPVPGPTFFCGNWNCRFHCVCCWSEHRGWKEQKTIKRHIWTLLELGNKCCHFWNWLHVAQDRDTWRAVMCVSKRETYLFIYLFININGGLLVMYSFQWRAVIYLCIYLNRRLLFMYLFKWRAVIYLNSSLSYWFVYINGGILLMYLFKRRAVIYYCIYLNDGLLLTYVFI